MIFSNVAIFTMIFMAESLSAQVYFQFEQANKIRAKKYSAGDQVTFRTNEFGENWLTKNIIEILPEDNALVFYDQITYLDEMTHFRYRRPWADIAGTNLMRFGVSWIAFGGVIEGLRQLDAIDTGYEFGVDTAVIGLSSIATGFLTKKLWARATKKLNERNRVRIIDTRF